MSVSVHTLFVLLQELPYPAKNGADSRVEIYTVPKKQRKKGERLFRHFRLSSKSLAPSPSGITKMSASSPRPSDISDEIVENQPQTLDHFTGVPLVYAEQPPQEDEEDTIAFIHFRTEYHSTSIPPHTMYMKREES